MIRQITFINKRKTLRGTLHLPDEIKKPVPGVIILHGFTANRTGPHRILRGLSIALQEAGIASLRFDFAGSGESDGEFSDMLFSGEISDAEAALNWFTELPDIDSKRLGIMGQSMGGTVAAGLISKVASFRSAVLWAAPISKNGTSIEETGEFYKGKDGRKYTDIRGYPVCEDFFKEFKTLDFPKTFVINVPDILFVHGTKDKTVPSSHSEECFRLLPEGKAKEFFSVPGGDHTFTNHSHKEAVIRKTVKWLAETLVKKSP
ncbi:MAG: alpha/beta hydrolase family protein [Fibrobacterota bacterium]